MSKRPQVSRKMQVVHRGKEGKAELSSSCDSKMNDYD